MLIYRFIFFFQAEDGIRDTSVTGVQTCALPISSVCFPIFASCTPSPARMSRRNEWRSEERRVGEEWRVWWCRGRVLLLEICGRGWWWYSRLRGYDDG